MPKCFECSEQICSTAQHQSAVPNRGSICNQYLQATRAAFCHWWSRITICWRHHVRGSPRHEFVRNKSSVLVRGREPTLKWIQHGSGSLDDVKCWWEDLSENGPALEYFPNAKKCWLIVKPERENVAKEVFGDTAINIISEGHKHLGVVLGSRSFLEEYDVGEKVKDWVQLVVQLAEFAISKPQASYAALTAGLRHRWSYFLRTLPNITNNTWATRACDNRSPDSRSHRSSSNWRRACIACTPSTHRGLGLANPVESSSLEYEASITATRPLVQRIVTQEHQPPN